MTVTIYSTPTCHFCHMAKEFFKENDIEYTDFDVSTDQEKRSEMMNLTGQLGVPVIVVTKEGESEPHTFVGFDEGKISEVLGV